jgi:hypothetical protein
VTRVEASRELPVSLEEGFAYITAVGNWRSYWPGLIDVPNEQDVSWRTPGDRASVVLRVRGRPVEMKMELAEFRPDDRVTYRSTQEDLPDFWHERHFRSHDGRLDYLLVIAYEPRPGVKGLIDRLFVRRSVRRALVETLDNLERIFRERATERR